MTKPIAILILAAGASTRMQGADKLLEVIGGQDLISRVTSRAFATGFPVYVAIATDRMERAKAIAHMPITIVPVADANEGMSASLRSGIRSLPSGLTGVLVMLADMPEITKEDLVTLLTHFAETGADHVVRATDSTGHPGHPVILPRRMFNALKRLKGDQGARGLLDQERVNLVRLPEGHAGTDLDTPQDWVAWRAGRNGE